MISSSSLLKNSVHYNFLHYFSTSSKLSPTCLLISSHFNQFFSSAVNRLLQTSQACATQTDERRKVSRFSRSIQVTAQTIISFGECVYDPIIILFINTTFCLKHLRLTNVIYPKDNQSFYLSTLRLRSRDQRA